MYFKRRTYYSFETPEEITNRIEEHSKSGILSYPNLTGKIINKERFILFQKWSFTIFSISPTPAIIEGDLKETNDQTKISILIRPDYRIFFILLISFVVVIVGILKLSNDFDTGIMLIFSGSLLFLFIHLFTTIALTRLRKNFESAFNLQ